MSVLGTIEEGVKWAMRFITSADKAYDLLKSEGYAWTRSAIRTAWKEVGEKEYWATVLETWGTDRKTPQRWQIEGPKGMTTEYQVILKYETMNKETGEIKEGYVSWATDKLVNFDEAYAEMKNDIEIYCIMQNAILLGWSPGGVLRKP